MASKAFLTAQREATRKAHAFLSSLRVGDIVLLDGQPITVARALYQADGFGAWESAQVQLSYGPGRYSTEVSAARIGAGYVKLERVPTCTCTPHITHMSHFGTALYCETERNAYCNFECTCAASDYAEQL